MITLSVSSFMRYPHPGYSKRARNCRKTEERRLVNLAYDRVGSGGEEDNVREDNVVGTSTGPGLCSNSDLWKINKEGINMRGRPADTDDVDQLVEMINLNSLRQHNHVVNPKKAAKKARQKARKEEERQLKLEAERALIEAEERKKLAEEQLEKTMRQLQNLKISKKVAKYNCSKECSQMKENKNIKAESRELGAKKSTCNQSKGSKGSFSSGTESKGKGLSVSNQCNSVCNKPCVEYKPASQPVATAPVASSGKKSKKNKKNQQPQEVKPVEYCSHTCSSHPSCGVPPPVVRPTAQEPEEDPESASSKKARKKARQQLRRAQLAAAANGGSASSVADTQQKQTVQTCNYGHPVIINVPNSPFSHAPSSSKIPVDNGSDLKVGSRLDWNSMSGEAASSSSKPEMVTIRRHPTVSDTTVTISIKNQNGDEDVLYTLLNGQVVRSKPDTVDIESFITEPLEKTTSKKSKKKRNKKKSAKKEIEKKVEIEQSPMFTSELIDLKPVTPRERDVVTCVPVMQSSYTNSSTMLPNGPRLGPVPEVLKSRSSYSFFNELDDGAEIDLSKLKLPPGITITKVNQAVSSFAGLGQVDKDKHSNDNVEMTYADRTSSNSTPSSCGGPNPNTSGPSLYYSDGFHSKPNVIVVDSQEYNADNESDTEDFVGFKKRPNKFEEVVSVKAKRLRNRVNRYLYGDETNASADRQEGIPEKVLTPAQASVYLNQHMPNRVKTCSELSADLTTRNSSGKSIPGAYAPGPDLANIPPTSTNRQSSCGSKRKQPMSAPPVTSMPLTSATNFFQPPDILVQPGCLNGTFSSNFSQNSFRPGQSNVMNPFTTNYLNYASQSVTGVGSVVHDMQANSVSLPPPTNNDYGNWAPPVRPSTNITSTSFGARHDYLSNKPFYFRANDSH